MKKGFAVDLPRIFSPLDVYSPREDSLLLAGAVEIEKGSKALDLGCGSGIQGINAGLKGTESVLFSDVSNAALECARKNAQTFGVLEKSDFRQSNLFENIPEKFDLVIFNPPYVPSEKIVDRAVDGGRKGREVIEPFLSEMPVHLLEGGKCFFLQSSLNGKKETKKILEENGLDGKIVARQRLFFEEIMVFKCFKQ